MGFLILILLLIPIGIGYLFLEIARNDILPKIEDEYWGPKSEQGKPEDTSIRPFKIDIQASVLDDLKARLKRELDSNRLVAPLEGIGFQYGFNSKYLKTVGEYWLNKYDWKGREKLLNKYPHFKTRIGGLDIHFQHVKPAKKNGVVTRPVLIMHGWPETFVQYQKLIPLLSEPQGSKYNYELIIPSLPGFGFSSGPSRPGLGATEMTNILKRLMNRLGLQKFFVMGADFGAGLASEMATAYSESVIGGYSTGCADTSGRGFLKYLVASAFPSIFASAEEAKYLRSLSETFSFMIRETGYLHIQMTKPDTVGTALTHSPLGLAAYILEKFSTETNRTWISREDGGITEKFTLDELLDNVMVYWVTGSITTSVRLYSDALVMHKRKYVLDKVPTNVPFDCHSFFEDLITIPKFAIGQKFTNVKRFKIDPAGGHFASFEVPGVVAEEAVSFFNSCM